MMTLSDVWTDAQMPAKTNLPTWMQALNAGGVDFVEGLQSRSLTPAASRNIPEIDLPDPAIEDAYRRGEEAARVQAESLADKTERARRDLRLRFGEIDQLGLEAMEIGLAETVLSLCEQVLAPFAIKPEALAQRCKVAAGQLGRAASDCALHLHPDDVPLLDSGLTQNWRIVEDPDLERGSVVFESADGTVSDGPAEWRAAIAQAIGLKSTRL